jgi:hypothetical protein
MNIPEWAIQGIVGGTVGFIFKVVFGLIAKNEEKSDEADRRLQEEIKDVREEMRAMDERHRQHENDLFNRSADAREAVAYMRAKVDTDK